MPEVACGEEWVAGRASGKKRIRKKGSVAGELTARVGNTTR